jgi:hypothetical protein
MLYLSGRKRREFFRPLRSIWTDNISKCQRKEIEDVDWIYLAQDKAHWPVLFAHLNELLSSVRRGQFFFFCNMKKVGFRKYPIVPYSMELFHM